MIRYLIGALSGQQMAERRKNCLRTWVADCELLNIPTVFLIGIPSITKPILHGHNLLLPCPDAYNTLPQRTRWFCKWALKRDDWDYALKCDDDTYVSIIRLTEYQPKGEYVGSSFGSFCSGGAGYLISRRCATIIAKQMTVIRGAEDVVVGKLLRVSRIPITNDSRFEPYNRIIPSAKNNQITAHYIYNNTFDQIHSEVGIKTKFRI